MRTNDSNWNAGIRRVRLRPYRNAAKPGLLGANALWHRVFRPYFGARPGGAEAGKAVDFEADWDDWLLVSRQQYSLAMIRRPRMTGRLSFLRVDRMPCAGADLAGPRTRRWLVAQTGPVGRKRNPASETVAVTDVTMRARVQRRTTGSWQRRTTRRPGLAPSGRSSGPVCSLASGRWHRGR